MRPLRLVMRAFGPYAAEQVLDFTRLGSAACFLIHGPTGAGKSSILDAICFALYGESSGGERDPRRLRSDFAPAATATEVVFDFRLGDDDYRVSRSPEFERPKSRGEGTTKQAARACLWKRPRGGASGDGQPLATQPHKVTAEIVRLIGFAREQFTKVVMLPQGKFRELLQADSKRREEILEILFQTEAYRRMEDALKARAKVARDLVEDLRREREHHLADAGVSHESDLGPLLDQQVGERQRIECELERLATERAAATEALQAARRTVALVTDRREAEAALEALRLQAPANDEARQRVSRARRALPVAEIDATVGARRTEAEAARRGLEACREARALAAAAHASACEVLAAEERLEPERERLQRDLAGLEAIAGRVLELDEARALAGRLAVECGVHEASARDLEDRRRECAEAADAARKALDGASMLASRVESSRAAAEALERAVTSTTKAEKARADLRLAQTAIEQAATARAAADECEAAAARRVTAIEAAWAAGRAGVLALGLRDAEPCPVCGALDHPRPASSRDLTSDRDLDEARAAHGRARDQQAAARTAEARARAAVEALDAVVTGLQGHSAPAASTADLKRQLADAVREADAARDAAATIGARAAGLDEARQRLEALDRSAADATRVLEESRRGAATQAGRVSELERAIPEHLRATGATDDAIRRARASVEQRARALTEARRRRETANAALAAAEAAALAADTHAETAARLEHDAADRLDAGIRTAGFASVAEFREARLDADDIARMDEAVRRFDEDLEAATQRSARAAAACAATEVPDLGPLEEAVRASDAAVSARNRELGESAERSRFLTRVADALSVLEGRLRQAEADFGCIESVSSVCSGQNSKRMTLQRYVLAALLDDVLVAASERFRRMSRGRFTLERDRQIDDGRRAGGLDLLALDAFTGTARPVNTLSGGEGFQASLALALGLSDVVQNYAAGIRLDTIFVDEGFGSLDEEALDLALETLMQLREGGRLVGIISHVTELQRRIDARLEVRPSAAGSEARLVL